MGKTFSKGENSRKTAGNAKKAENAAVKQKEETSRAAAAEDKEWAKGVKGSARKEDVAAKKAEAAAKKAERDAQLAAEEANARSTPKNSKSAPKKTSVAPSKGLDLSQLDESPSRLPDLNASGIDNALDALTITGSSATTDASKIDRHPERRFKAAYLAFEAKRLPEMEAETPGLRRNQRVELVKKEFAKHSDNPFNQVTGNAFSTGSDLREIAEKERERLESLLASR